MIVMNTDDPFYRDEVLIEDVGMFEAAVHAQSAVLPEISVPSVLAAIDDSNQSDTTRLIAARFGARLGAPVVERTNLRTDEAILAAIREASAGLLVLPAPFGSDIRELKDESLGEVVDQLLGHATIPILTVRQPMDGAAIDAALTDIVLPLSPGEPRNEWAVAWAFRLLNRGGQCRLLEIADEEVLAEAERLVSEDDGHSSWQQGMTRCFAGLIGVAQRRASDAGLNVAVLASTGRFVAESLAAAHDLRTLTIAVGSHDRRSTTYHRAVDLILGSAGPVLVV